VKKFLSAAFIACLIPTVCSAEILLHHHRIRAIEMTGIGAGGALLIGAIGYLLLRRKSG
jgi:hypothetical protein